MAVNDSDLHRAQSWAQARITRLAYFAEKAVTRSGALDM
jgi:hypothetical protein